MLHTRVNYYQRIVEQCDSKPKQAKQTDIWMFVGSIQKYTHFLGRTRTMADFWPTVPDLDNDIS